MLITIPHFTKVVKALVDPSQLHKYTLSSPVTDIPLTESMKAWNRHPNSKFDICYLELQIPYSEFFKYAIQNSKYATEKVIRCYPLAGPV